MYADPAASYPLSSPIPFLGDIKFRHHFTGFLVFGETRLHIIILNRAKMYAMTVKYSSGLVSQMVMISLFVFLADQLLTEIFKAVHGTETHIVY